MSEPAAKIMVDDVSMLLGQKDLKLLELKSELREAEEKLALAMERIATLEREAKNGPHEV